MEPDAGGVTAGPREAPPVGGHRPRWRPLQAPHPGTASHPGSPAHAAVAGPAGTGDDTPGRAQAVETATELALSPHGAGLAAVGTEAMALVVAAVAAAGIEVLTRSGPLRDQTVAFSTILLRLVVTVPLLVLTLAAGRRRFSLRSTLAQHVEAVASPLAIGGLAAIALWRIAAAVDMVRPPSTDALLLLCLLGLLTVTMVRQARGAPRRRGGRRSRRVVIVGSGVVANRLADQLQTTDGVDLVGFVDDDPVERSRCLGGLGTLASVCQRNDVDHVIVAFSRASSEQVLDALRPLHGRVPITVVPRLFDVLPATAALHDLGSGLTGISVPPATLGVGARAVKRTIDLVGAGAALLVLSPVLAVTAVAVRLTSPGRALLRQERVGRDGRPFDMVKFRSMRMDRPAVEAGAGGEQARGPFRKLKRDPRVTPVGQFIRRTSVDELPQLWNVVTGQMSLVGPRPFVPGDAAWIDGWARRRYAMRPGITGLWQVSGRNDLTFDDMCRLDSMYVASWSIELDLRILVRTLRAVLTGHGAY